MRSTISQRELRNDSGAIMRRVEAGEWFTVTRNGSAVAVLGPLSGDDDDRPRFVPVDRIAEGIGALPEWGRDGFASELGALDEAVDDAIADPWARE